jgi:uncharacterized MAPEG superfamily protein
MQTEYIALTFMTLFFIFAWLPASAGKLKHFGVKWATSNRDKTPHGELPSWAARCDRAYANLKDYFPGFVVAIILLGLTNKFDNSTAIGASLYVLARLGHFFFYGIGNFQGRFISFMISLGCNVFLLIKVLL